MVLDTAKLKDRKSTIYHGMHGRYATKELTRKVNIDQGCRESQLLVGWTEQKCAEMYVLAKGDHAYHFSREEFTLIQSGKNATVRLRPDFRAAVSLKNRVHRESVEAIAEPISPQQYRR